jgi:outer membrane biogenesis lipoprotein LolB
VVAAEEEHEVSSGLAGPWSAAATLIERWKRGRQSLSSSARLLSEGEARQCSYRVSSSRWSL